jgi:hypothetical protein
VTSLVLDSTVWYGYHATGMTVLLFIKDLIVATFGQMASLFAGVFIFGLLIHFLSQLTFKSLERSFGSRGVYLVAWLGTPIHEMGHALFCLIFLHKIVEIKFFEPDPLTGTLGYVYHKWNKKNPWQVLGNFFIGIGPVILGSAVLLAVFYILIPGSSRVWDAILIQANEINTHSLGSYFEIWQGSALALVKLIFTVENLTGWRFWVFLYLAICVSSNIRLSWSDIKHSLSGLGCIVIPFLLLNLVSLIAGIGSDDIIPFTAASLGAVYGVLILALVMVLVGFILIYIIAAINYRLKYRAVLKPF